MRDWSPSRTFEFEGRTVRYDVMGEGAPMVLLHGTPFSSWEWHRIAPLLARDRRVFFHDMAGYGESEKAEGQDVSLAAQTRLLVALLRHWDLDEPDVIAHDFGGAIALRAHLLDGVDYRRLLLIDPVAARPWGSPFVQHVREHEPAFAGLPDYLHLALVTAYVRTAIHREIPTSELEPYVRPWLGEAGKPALYRQVAQMDLRYTDEIEPLLGDIRCPVSLLWGEEDAWIPLSDGRAVADKIGPDRFRTVPGSGHLMQEDAPEAIVAEAGSFFGMERRDGAG
jgi:pimeloyl-ACP methyl ester carboxylesterase